jgi:hypothetical protein
MQRRSASEHQMGMSLTAESTRPAHVSFRSVFDVDGSRLGIGVFNRPLLDEEYRSLRKAWERSGLPGLVDFEINRKQVSFLTQPVTLEAAWRSIDRILATPTDRATS